MSGRWSRTNRLIVAAARRLGVEAEAVGSEHSDFFMRLRWPEAPEGPRTVIVSKTRSPFLTQVAQTLSNNKFLARELLAARGLPMATGLLLDESTDPRRDAGGSARARDFFKRHGEVVVKPNWGNRGLGVTTGIVEFSALLRAFGRAVELDRDEEVLLEPQLAGVDLRVAVIGGDPVAAVEIRRPVLVGDGQRSFAGLVEALNVDPRRGSWDRPGLDPLDRVELDEVAELLAVSGRSPADVPEAGARLVLPFEEAEVIDRSDALHHGWGELAATAARALGVDVAGVDLRGPASELFERGPAPEGATRLLEVNVLPALHLHALPTEGEARPVFEAFVAYCLQMPGAPPICADVQV
ncbi:hypothetical protein G6O69_31225 [Pseudenhygromyxa sp. WMMC2535]|uniref:hypothetical protein n=1 Tax=Pseudenhygromyxa sp. WMMC2535 TaxID=2712867 RepID=UPI001553A97E|nr:hypothetical protein [Pseudenhygromyxa sp. WMMC2535]NVB42336.1 hypothetical protein [Pseudenhygromyxa sp. WMMC2535]